MNSGFSFEKLAKLPWHLARFFYACPATARFTDFSEPLICHFLTKLVGFCSDLEG
jgi:hypothetical protein